MDQSVKKAIICQKIIDFSIESFLPIFPRSLSLGKPYAPKAGNLVNVVVGMRRSGKTYRLLQEIQTLLSNGVSQQNILYFNFEDERLRPFEHNLGNDVLEAFFELYPHTKVEGAYLFFDEVQVIPDWGIWLRRVVDTERVTLTVTGSSAKILSTDVATEFRGRSISHELLPFGFSEYIRFHEIDLPEKSALTSKDRFILKKHFENYLLRGGFPAVQNEQEDRATSLLQLYAEQVVARDVIERHNLSNPQAIALFAKQVLAHSGRCLSLRKTEDRLNSYGIKVGRNSLSEALSYLEDAFLIARVLPISRALSDDPKVAARIYAIDPGLARANALALTEDRGQLFEDAVYLELRRRNPHRRERYLSSLKTKGGREVDFLVGDILADDTISLYQACISIKDKQSFDRETRALREAMAEYGCKSSTILTLEDEVSTIVFDEGIINVIPLWEWSLGKY